MGKIQYGGLIIQCDGTLNVPVYHSVTNLFLIEVSFLINLFTLLTSYPVIFVLSTSFIICEYLFLHKFVYSDLLSLLLLELKGKSNNNLNCEKLLVFTETHKKYLYYLVYDVSRTRGWKIVLM